MEAVAGLTDSGEASDGRVAALKGHLMLGFTCPGTAETVGRELSGRLGEGFGVHARLVGSDGLLRLVLWESL